MLLENLSRLPYAKQFDAIEKTNPCGVEHVETLLNPTYQVLTLTFLSQLFTLGQQMSTTVNGGANAVPKGHTRSLAEQAKA